MREVAAYYHETLKQSPEALDVLGEARDPKRGSDREISSSASRTARSGTGCLAANRNQRRRAARAAGEARRVSRRAGTST